MISLELSMVQHNKVESARLAAAMDEFLSRGGHIQEAEPFGYVPRPVLYGSYATPGKAVERVKPEPKPAPKPKREPRAEPVTRSYEAARAAAQAKIALVAKVREMAKTMTQAQASTGTGIHRTQLYRMAKAYGFEFRPPANNGHSNLVHNQSDPAADARNVERIKAMRDLGINRRQASRRMGISSTLMRRLIKDYSIDYPVSTRSKQCVG